MRLISDEEVKKLLTARYEGAEYIIKDIDKIPTAYDVGFEIRLLENYLYHKPKTYRQRNQNFVVVRDLLMRNTSHAGMTSCITKCRELGIDPYGYDLKGGGQDV